MLKQQLLKLYSRRTVVMLIRQNILFYKHDKKIASARDIYINVRKHLNDRPRCCSRDERRQRKLFLREIARAIHHTQVCESAKRFVLETEVYNPLIDLARVRDSLIAIRDLRVLFEI